MRLVQVLIPEGKRASVLSALNGEGIDYAVFDETGRGDFEAMVQFPVPPNGVEPVMDELREAGVKEDAYTIVLPTETVVSSRIRALRAMYPGDRISRDELVARAEDLAPRTQTYLAFLVLSTVIATTGLLLNSAATIIGAMVVAPLMGPAISASVGSVLADRDLAYRGVRLQILGLILAVVTAALLGLFIKQSYLVPPGLDIRTIPQVSERTNPNFLSLFLALGSGLAGAISVYRNAGSALVGVAIAVALIPPAATAGLGIAWGVPGVAIAATVLVLVNLLAINLSAVVLFWIAGYRPEETGATARARSSVLSRVAVLVVAIALLSVVLGAVTYASFQSVAYEHEVNTSTKQFLNQSDYQQFDYVSANVNYTSADVLLGNRPSVRVVVSRPPGVTAPSDLADRLHRHLTATTGTPVKVEVGIVEVQRSGSVTPRRFSDAGANVPVSLTSAGRG